MGNALRKFAVALTSVLAALCVLWAVLAVRELALPTAVIAVGFLTTCLMLIAVMQASKNISADGAFDETGTLLHPSSRIVKHMHRFVVTGTITIATCLAVWGLGGLYTPLLPGGLFAIFAVWLGVTALILLWTWWKSSTQGGLTYLVLTPEGFEFPTLWSTKSGSWADVTAIADKLPDGERFWNPMVLTMKDGSKLTMEAPGIFTEKGTALVAMTRFYWQHPHQRDELTDGRALARLATFEDIARAE